MGGSGTPPPDKKNGIFGRRGVGGPEGGRDPPPDKKKSAAQRKIFTILMVISMFFQWFQVMGATVSALASLTVHWKYFNKYQIAKIFLYVLFIFILV